MKIVFATETFLPSVDGVVTRITHTLDRLSELGHDVTIVCPDLGCTSYAGFEVVGVKAVTYPVYRSRPWGSFSPKVARVLDRVKPDIVHVWQPAIIGFSAVLAARKRGIPLISSYHTNVDKYLNCYGPVRVFVRPIMRLMRWLNNTSPLTLVTSNAMHDYLGDRGFLNLRVLPRGVDAQTFTPRAADAETRMRLSGGRPDAPLLLFVGRVAYEKGLDTLVPLMQAHPEWSLAIVGDGPARADLERAFRGTHTMFTGFLTGEALSHAFASADAFVFPSRTETLGLVILESMASGVPVIAAHSPATDEQIRNGIDGLIYDPDIPDDLEQAVLRVVNDRQFARSLADAGLEQARRQDWRVASDAVIQAYRDTLALYAAGWREPLHPARLTQQKACEVPSESGAQ